MIRSTIVPMYYKDYFVNFAPEPYFGGMGLNDESGLLWLRE